MRQLIQQTRKVLPFDMPESQVCHGECNGCSLKLLNYLDDELEQWRVRLEGGEKPGLAELSRLAKISRRVYKVVERNGLLQ